MMSSGNHEAILNFTAYRKRVGPTVPWAASGGWLHWYSFNVGRIHFVSFDIDQPWEAGTPQYSWIAADLAAVDRSITPWVIAFNHFPMLCSNQFWCPDAGRFRALYEPLFNAVPTRVDVYLSGHVHAAEVLWPNVNGTVVQPSFNGVNTTLQVMRGANGGGD